MADLVVVAFDQPDTADRVLRELTAMGKEKLIELEDACVVVEIADNGPGIPEAERGKVFDRFYRLDRSRSTAGSGLGLALVAKIVGDHGGIIECESQPRKTVFRVLMPMFNASSHTTDQSNRDDVPGTPLHASIGTR